MKIYSLQRDRNGNMIVCGDTVERAGTYVIVATGSYREMLVLKDADRSSSPVWSDLMRRNVGR